MKKTIFPLIYSLCCTCIVIGLACTLIEYTLACTQQDAKTAANIGVKIAEEACKETIDAGIDPAWVDLSCQAIDNAGTIVHILMPRKEWHAIRARASSADAGPGK